MKIERLSRAQSAEDLLDVLSDGLFMATAATSFTCHEADTVATFLHSHDRTREARAFIKAHADGDVDDTDLHKTFTFDTNAGPIVAIIAADLDAAKADAESQIPLLREDGNVWTWEAGASEPWHIIVVTDADGHELHRAAIRPGALR